MPEPTEVAVALSPKERERIIEEETLRYETRQNLCKKSCAGRPVRWPWILLGIALVAMLWSHIFCRGGSCAFGSHMGPGHTCTGMTWAPDGSKGVEPGQPVQPAQPEQK
jgi:hypothetical protein